MLFSTQITICQRKRYFALPSTHAKGDVLSISHVISGLDCKHGGTE